MTFQLESSQQHEIEYYCFKAPTGRNLSNVSQSLVSTIFKILALKRSYVLTLSLGHLSWFSHGLIFNHVSIS